MELCLIVQNQRLVSFKLYTFLTTFNINRNFSGPCNNNHRKLNSIQVNNKITTYSSNVYSIPLNSYMDNGIRNSVKSLEAIPTELLT